MGRRVVLLAFLAACSSSQEPAYGPGPGPPSTIAKCVDEPAPTTSPAVTLLSNGDPAIELLSGGKLALHYGSQGGQHTFVWVRVFYDTTETITAETEIRDGTGEVGFGGSAVLPKCAGKWREVRITTFRQSSFALTDLTLKVTVIAGSGTPLVTEVPVQID